MPSSLPLRSGMTSPIARGGAGEFGIMVERGGARAAQVGLAVREVELQLLIARVRVHRLDEALLDRRTVVQHLRHRRQAVGRAGRVRDHVCSSASYIPVVDAHADHDVGVARRRGDDRPAWRRPRGASARRLAVGEEAGRLDHDVDAVVAPRDSPGSRSLEVLDLLPSTENPPSPALPLRRACRPTESCLSRYAIVSASPRSFTATSSTSPPRLRCARKDCVRCARTR